MTTSTKWTKTRHECIWSRQTSKGPRYQVRARIGAGRPMYVETFEVLDDAIDARDRARGDVKAGRPVLNVSTVRVTVGDVAAQYLTAKAPAWSPGTRRVNAAVWNALDDTFGAIPVVSLSEADVSDWYDAQTKAPATTKQRLDLLRAVLDRASSKYGVANVARLFKPQRRRGSGAVRKVRDLPFDVAFGAIDAAQPHLRIMVELALYLGLRSGEVRGLTEDRIDWNPDGHAAIRIDRQLVWLTSTDDYAPSNPAHYRLSDTLAFGPPKTDNSDGTVYAGPAVQAMIREHLELYGQGRAGLIVHDDDGDPIPPDVWTDEFQRISTALGVRVTGHSLRHTRAMYGIARGDSPDVVAGDLRNTMQQTVKAYLHPTVDGDGSRSDDMVAAVSAAGARTARAGRHLRAV